MDSCNQAHFKVHSLVISVVISTVLGTGCSALKPSPAADSGFLEQPERLVAEDAISGKWVSEKYISNKENYKKILIKPINIDYLKKTGDWSHIQVSSEDEIKKDAAELAAYFESRLREAFEKGEVKDYILAETPGPDTMSLEIALVEVIPTDVARNAAGNVVGFFVPGGGLVSAGAGGSIAFESRITDSATGEVLIMAKDRRKDKITPVDIAGLTAYRHARQNINDWVDGFVYAFNSPIEEKVRVSAPITLSPW